MCVLGPNRVSERWRRHYNSVRPHSCLGYRPPAPESNQPLLFSSTTSQRTKGAGPKESKTVT
ncbi:MAG: hypothetical protein CMJ72_05660 [Planctomycetaceae bacterium]|nr:hypothetical protein [Planctomycetaceae bacterium]